MTRVLPDIYDVACWPLDEAAAPFLNVQGSGGALSLAVGAGGCTPNQTGRFNKAVQFPGGDVHGYIYSPDVAGAFEPSSSISISYWVYLTAYHNQACHVNKLYRPSLSWTSPWTTFGVQENSTVDGQFAIIMTAATGVVLKWASGSSYKIPLNTWCFVGAVYDRSANQVRGYLNGVRAITQSESRAIDWGTHGAWMIGGDPSPHCITGKIDDVRVANVARDDAWFSNVWQIANRQVIDSPRENQAGFGDSFAFKSASSKTPHVPADAPPAGHVEEFKREFAGGIGESSQFYTADSALGVQQWHTNPQIRGGYAESLIRREHSGAFGADYYELKRIGSVGGGLPISHVDPRLPMGMIRDRLTEHAAGLGDVLAYGLGMPDYGYGKTDVDGRTYIGNGGIVDVFYYDATVDRWHSPTASGFYGVGRDGLYYYDGQPTLQGSFGTIAGGLNRRSWSFGGATELMGLWYYSGRTSYTVIADGKVRETLTNGANWESCPIDSSFRWFLSGDFDVQVSFENYSPHSGPSDGGAWMEIGPDADNYTYVRRHVGGNYDKDVRIGGSWGSYSSAGSAGTSGRMRVVRSGSNVSSYYWSGSSWTQIGSTRSGFPTTPVHVRCSTGGTGGTYTYTVDWFDFIINSGTVIYTAGWAREAAGTYRGSRPDFPTHSLIVCTATTVDIIDADNNKLWMRFERGSERMLHTWSPGTQSPARVAMKDGVLVIANRTPLGSTQEGGGIVVDFNVDGVFQARDAASGATGSVLRPANYVSSENWMNFVAYGLIVGRNSGKGWMWDNNQFRIQGYQCHDVDIAFSGAYCYRAFATTDGVTIHRWYRWRLEGDGGVGGHILAPLSTYATTAGPIHWCAFDPETMALYYMSSSGLHSVNKTTYEATLTAAGNTQFTPDTTATLPESASAIQKTALKIGTGVYWPGSMCIWLSTWPGAWTKLYGPPGSGAFSEMLPEGCTIESMSYKIGTDLATYLFVCIREKSGARWLLVINETSRVLGDRILISGPSAAAVAVI